MDDEEEHIVYIDGLRVTPTSITSDGVWIGEDGMQCDIRDMRFNVPEDIKGGPYPAQSVLAVLSAKDAYNICPECNEEIPEDGVLLMMETFHVYPSLCCQRMVWMRNGGSSEWPKEMA